MTGRKPEVLTPARGGPEGKNVIVFGRLEGNPLLRTLADQRKFRMSRALPSALGSVSRSRPRAPGWPCSVRGFAHDDFYRDGKTNYQYEGYELKLLHWLRPEQLEAGLRFDRYEYEFSESGNRIARNHWTLGINYYWEERSKIQMNYTWKDTREAYEPDLDDDLLVLNFQFAF